MKKLTFYDLKTKKKFESSKYSFVKWSGKGKTMFFAKTISPSGNEARRIISLRFYKDKK